MPRNVVRAGRPGAGPSGQDPLAGWSRLPAGAQALLTALAYLAGAALAAGLARATADVFPFWPAAGVGAVALLLAPVRRWALLCVAIGVGSATFSLLAGIAPPYALGLAGADALVALAGAATTLALTHGRRPDWTRLSHVWATIAGVGVAGPVIGGVAGAAFAVADGGGQFARAWLQWGSGAGIGGLLVAGLFLAVPADGRVPLGRRAEAAACMVAAALLCGLPLGLTDLPLTWVAMLPLFWAALRLGPIGTAFTVCVIAAVTITLTAQGLGIYGAGRSMADALLLAQGFLLVAVAFGASHAAVTSGQARAAEELRASQEQLRAGAEDGGDRPARRRRSRTTSTTC